MDDDSAERRIRRLLAETAIRPPDDEFGARVARRISAKLQWPSWTDVDRLARILVPVVLFVTAWLTVSTVASALAPALTGIASSSVGAMLPLAIAAIVFVYTWIRA